MSDLPDTFMSAAQPQLYGGIRFRVGLTTGARIGLHHFTAPGRGNPDDKGYIPDIYTTVDAFNRAVRGLHTDIVAPLTTQNMLVAEAYRVSPQWVKDNLKLLEEKPDTRPRAQDIRATLRAKNASPEDMRKALLAVFRQDNKAVKSETQLFDEDRYYQTTVGAQSEKYYRLSQDGINALMAMGYFSGKLMFEMSMNKDDKKSLPQVAQILHLRGCSPIERAFTFWKKPFDLVRAADMEPIINEFDGPPTVMPIEPPAPLPDWTINPWQPPKWMKNTLNKLKPSL